MATRNDFDAEAPFQPLDLIFSCNICHDSIRDIRKPVLGEDEFFGVRKPVARLWMTECAHLICAKHLEGGAPPFHPAGEPPRAVCPVCVTRQNNHGLKQMYAISGYSQGEHDSQIPRHFFQCPPVALDAKDAGMDALRFQFLGLVTYGIATATKFCGLQAAHSHLKDEIDKLRLEKTENENEVLALTSRIALLEEAEIRHKRREPEVRHYLEQFALMKSELDRRNEELTMLGRPPPQIDYTFPPSHLYKDKTSKGRENIQNESSGNQENRNGFKQPKIANQAPSASSTTLRGNSSRTNNEESDENVRTKRQKISDFRYNPQPLQPSPDRPTHAEGLMAPPRANLANRQNQATPDSCWRPDSRTPFVHGEDETTRKLERTDLRVTNLQPWDQIAMKGCTKPPLGSPPYMSGALAAGSMNSIQPLTAKNAIQPVDSLNNVSRFTDTTPDLRRGYASYHPLYNINYEIGPGASPMMPQLQYQSNPYAETSLKGPPYADSFTNHDLDQTSQFQQADRGFRFMEHTSPYREPHQQPRTHCIWTKQHSDDDPRYTPHRVGSLRQTEGLPVSSPFFRESRHPQSSRQHQPSTPMIKSMTSKSKPDPWTPMLPKHAQRSSSGQSQTLNGLSFVTNPCIDSGYSSSFGAEPEYHFHGNHPSHRVPRDSNGLLMRPGVHSGSLSTASPRHEPYFTRHRVRPQPLPSATPSLASSINAPQPRRIAAYDNAIANVRGVKGAFTGSNGFVGSRAGLFQSSGRRSVKR